MTERKSCEKCGCGSFELLVFFFYFILFYLFFFFTTMCVCVYVSVCVFISRIIMVYLPVATTFSKIKIIYIVICNCCSPTFIVLVCFSPCTTTFQHQWCRSGPILQLLPFWILERSVSDTLTKTARMLNWLVCSYMLERENWALGTLKIYLLLFLGCLTLQAKCVWGTNLLRQVYLLLHRDKKCQIKLGLRNAASPSDSVLTPSLPVLALTL